MARVPGYKLVTDPGSSVRLIAVLPKEDVERMDAWGIAAGMPSRTATIRHLLAKALDAAAAQTKAGTQ